MKQRYAQSFRTIMLVTPCLLLVTLLIGFIWGWATALAFIIGGTFFALCCFLSYYQRIWFSFNNIPDTNMNSTVALMTRSIPKLKTPSRPGSELETFTPFTFKQNKEKELEDMRVRALLRQVFSDNNEEKA